MPRLYSDLPAVVLDSHDHGESDKILTFFCRDVGRFSAIAKGAHRSRKRFVNKLELFSFLHITCSLSAPGRLAVITEAELLNAFINLRSNFSTYQAASIVREFLLLAGGEKLRDDTLLQLLLWALHALNSGMERKTVVACFLVKLFDCIGFRPELARCQRCGAMRQGNNSELFNALLGGFVCSQCHGGITGGEQRLSAGTIRTIEWIQQQQPARLNRYRPGRPVLQETLDCLYGYGRHLFQREIVSWKYLS